MKALPRCASCGAALGRPLTQHGPGCTIEPRDVAMRSHRLAEEIADRVRRQEALGRPSIYNIAREVLIEEFAGRTTAEPTGEG